MVEKEHHSLPMRKDTEEDVVLPTEEWVAILDKIIWAFRYAAEGSYPFSGDHLTETISWKEYDKLPLEKRDALWANHEKRYQEGMELFSLWFRDFWD